MRQVQILVVSPQGDYERIELFKDETIMLTQTIQNARDIGSIFTDFTQSFTVPASKSNNILFDFYYNSDIADGYNFNANDKREAQILLNSQLFRKGYLALNSVQMKDNNPFSYKVTFFGETVDLKKQLKDVTLRSLYEGFTNYNHDYDITNVIGGLVSSLFNGKIIYPLISHTERYFYDSSTHAAGSRNLHYVQGGGTSHNQGVNFRDLKPAIKISDIFDRINSQTNLDFDTSSGFLSISNSAFQNLYLWLSRERGNLGRTYTGSTNYRLNVESITNFFPDGGYSGGTTMPIYHLSNPNNPIICQIESGGLIRMKPFWSSAQQRDKKLRIDYTVTSSSEYSMYLVDTLTNTVVKTNLDVTGTNSIAYEVIPSSVGDRPDVLLQLRIETFDGSFVATSQTVRIRHDYMLTVLLQRTEYTRSNTLSPNALLNQIDIPTQMPEMKLLDFLTGLFKVFNLTAFYNSQGKIVVQTLDSFYSVGQEFDITEYVDSSKKTVSYPIPFQEIAFRYAKPKTFLAINFEEINGYQYGNLENSTTNNNVQQTDRGSKYVVKTPFEKVIYEGINDLSTGASQNIVYGWTVDKDQNPVAPAPLIFYRRLTTTTNGYSYQDINAAGQATTFNRASNSLFQKTLNFNTEIDEFTGTVKPDSLFMTYYRQYISSLFNRSRRLINVKAYLPLNFLLEYGLNDILVINGKAYNINSIKTNLQTGESELELFNKINT